MLLIKDILVSADLLESEFVCKLESCKGACCWEGDYGAPLEEEEMAVLENILPAVRPFLSNESLELLDRSGPFTWYAEKQMHGTTLHPDGACVFLTYDDNGIAKCGIENAWKAGETDFQKPVSCHLYPVRVQRNEELHFEALNYDRWDICNAACAHGKDLGIPLYRFVSKALIRKYGEEFYAELDEVASQWKEGDES
jgi:hypothetical protein